MALIISVIGLLLVWLISDRLFIWFNNFGCNIDRDGYKMEPLLTKKEGICDVCGGKLIIRPDDTE